MGFRGWPPEALTFYEGLEADNTKAYWTANKAVFEDAVKAPMLALCAELEPQYGPLRMFRPNRDIRFCDDLTRPIGELMTRDNLITVPVGTTLEDARTVLHQHRIEKLPVVDAYPRVNEQNRCPQGSDVGPPASFLL